MSKPVLILTDEYQEAIYDVQLVYDLLCMVDDNPSYWKWVFIVLHNALQGFMVLGLHGGYSTSIFTKKSIRIIPQTDSIDINMLKLEYFMNLYEKIQSEAMLLNGNSKIFEPKDNQSQSIKQLQKIRNNFMHYIPRDQEFYTINFPRIVIDCIDIIEFLALDSGNVFLEKRNMHHFLFPYLVHIRERSSNLIEKYEKKKPII